MEINSSDRKPTRRRVTSALKLDDSTAVENLETTRRDLSDLRKPHAPFEGVLPHLARLNPGDTPPRPNPEGVGHGQQASTA
ncbi:hypothetical protein IWX78_002325 [Mycetocola sp. CAN_C7]|uniref:hypothetical protein n=1 Tax=Mycetocola sp. CAN_C7 TaxID=2787724 RepID=UPI0018CAE237